MSPTPSPLRHPFPSSWSSSLSQSIVSILASPAPALTSDDKPDITVCESLRIFPSKPVTDCSQKSGKFFRRRLTRHLDSRLLWSFVGSRHHDGSAQTTSRPDTLLSQVPRSRPPTLGHFGASTSHRDSKNAVQSSTKLKSERKSHPTAPENMSLLAAQRRGAPGGWFANQFRFPLTHTNTTYSPHKFFGASTPQPRTQFRVQSHHHLRRNANSAIDIA